MFGGPEMYELAKHLSKERVRRAEHNRLVSHLEQLQAQAHREHVSANPPTAGTWTLEWTGNGLAGGRVTVTNPSTGKSRTGRHPFDWDQALSRALHGSG